MLKIEEKWIKFEKLEQLQLAYKRNKKEVKLKYQLRKLKEET